MHCSSTIFEPFCCAMSIYARLLPSNCICCCICIFCAVCGASRLLFLAIFESICNLCYKLSTSGSSGGSGACQSHYQHAVISFCISLGSTTGRERKRGGEEDSDRETTERVALAFIASFRVGDLFWFLQFDNLFVCFHLQLLSLLLLLLLLVVAFVLLLVIVANSLRIRATLLSKSASRIVQLWFQRLRQQQQLHFSPSLLPLLPFSLLDPTLSRPYFWTWTSTFAHHNNNNRTTTTTFLASATGFAFRQHFLICAHKEKLVEICMRK